MPSDTVLIGPVLVSPFANVTAQMVSSGLSDIALITTSLIEFTVLSEDPTDCH